MTGRVRTINSGTPFDHVEVDLQNALLAKKQFGQRHQCELRAFAEDRLCGQYLFDGYQRLCRTLGDLWADGVSFMPVRQAVRSPSVSG
jgi:hypothetical protein